MLFLVFRLQLFAENSAEDKPAERAAVEHLPAERHREVAAPGMHPCAKAGLLEQQGSDETHDRAHDADDHQGNREGLPCSTPLRHFPLPIVPGKGKIKIRGARQKRQAGGYRMNEKLYRLINWP